ncbi:MAG: chromosome segregation protein SMC [Nitrospinaceae bacterium]
MYLKSLELEGFKSFVDATELHFNNGFTAIVGPNGCGKSNVSDAIRWVIGEQSSKSLRGTRITDLIFNGSTHRKPVNRAAISLTLSHVSPEIRIANVTNLSDEVKITRCYHRSGESEFYINQVPCRLKDITDFLLDVGISPKILTVIEQGHIQDIITAKPEDRRILIEEAAGILKFKHRRNEAARKLEAAGQNLERINDIVQELGRRAESLKRQAAKAERYKKYQAEIKDLSLKLYSRKYRRYQKELEIIEEEFSRHNEQKARESARASTLENQITELHIEIDGLTKIIAEKKDGIYELSNRIGNDEHAIELKQSQIAQAEADIQAAVEEISRMNEEIQAVAGGVEEQRRQLANISEEINAREEALCLCNRNQDQDKAARSRLEEEVRSGEGRILALYQRISQKKNDLTALETRKHYLEGREDKLKREQEENLAQKDELHESLVRAETDLAQKVQQFSLLKGQRDALAQETEEGQKTLDAQTDRLAAVKEEYFARSSLLSSLKELRKKFEGFHDGIKSLMTYNANGGRLTGLREVLVDVLKAPAEYEAAIEAVLGEKLQSIIVNSYSDTVEAIEFLKSHRSGRGSFIPLRPKAPVQAPVRLNGNPSVMGRVLDFVECKEEYRTIIEHMLANVVLVQDLETALRMHQDPNFHGTVVTQNGEMVDPQGLVTGGEVQEDSPGLLSRNREIETLTAAVDRLGTEMRAAQAEIDQSKASLARHQENLKRIQGEVHEKEITQTNSHKDLEQMRKEVERLEQKHSTLEYERSSAFHELRELMEQRDTLTREMGSAEEEKSLEEEAQARVRADLVKCREELETKASEIGAIQVRIASLVGRRENILTDIKRLDLQQENLRQRIEKRQADQTQNKNRIGQTRQEIEDLEKRILGQVREKDQLTEERVRDGETLREQEEGLDRMEQETKQLTRRIQELMETISKIEIKRSEIKIEMAHLQEKIFDDFNVALPELLNVPEEGLDEKEAGERVQGLKAKVARMGDVNLAALSDYRETNERYTFLKKQQDDLVESITTLHETIEKINSTTRQRFLDTFERVNENFHAIFGRLFQGGKAKLTLTDPSNPLESGIEVTANPLGKTLQNLSLLSGGEKSLVAIALVFAVFKVRPSPFCLLDEVDAPLDEANVIRFQEMLKELAVDTQFILITHNQKTMSFADVLYGITMEERGVSKAVSVRLN